MKLSAVAAATALVAATPAFAQDTGGFQLGLTGGTLGIGPEIGFRTPGFGVRGNATFLGLGREVESDGVVYDGDLRLRSYGAMLDLYPGGGGFRLSAGARINNNRIDLSATPTADVEIGDEIFTPAEIGVLTGEVDTKNLAPMLTIGWGGDASPGFKFGIDAGALFQGSPRVSEFRSTGTLANDPAFQAELARERQEIEDDIDGYKIYPVLQLSLSYLFGGAAPAPAPYIAPAVELPPPPPPAPATQTCPDGSVILATDICPAPPPPPPPAPSGERG